MKKREPDLLERQKYADNLKIITFCGVALSTSAIISSVIVIPLIYSYIQRIQSSLVTEIELCKIESKHMWEEYANTEEYFGIVLPKRRNRRDAHYLPSPYINPQSNVRQYFIHQGYIKSYVPSHAQPYGSIGATYVNNQPNPVPPIQVLSNTPPFNPPPNLVSAPGFGTNPVGSGDAADESEEKGSKSKEKSSKSEEKSPSVDGKTDKDDKKEKTSAEEEDEWDKFKEKAKQYPRGFPIGLDGKPRFEPTPGETPNYSGIEESDCCSCLMGSPGDTGPQGEPGQDGNDGVPGEDGHHGPDASEAVDWKHQDWCFDCPEGAIGQPGPQGYPGPPGIEGPPGEDGPDGLLGSTGLIGPPGPLGPRGNVGPKGPQGAPGPYDLIPTPNGRPGIRGPPGIVGPDGTPGQPGRPGHRGVPGWPGDQGVPGRPGNVGIPGSPGTVGPDGRPGSCDHCPLPRLEDGYDIALNQRSHNQETQTSVEPSSNTDEYKNIRIL